MNDRIAIKIMNRQDAREFTHQPAKQPYAIISIRDVGAQPNEFAQNPAITGILNLAFDDVDAGERNCITANDATAILSFVTQMMQQTSNFLIHCEGGVSRSAGIAAALLLLYNNDDSSVFTNPRLCPNETVYTSLLTAAQQSMPEQCIRRRFDHQLQLWMAEHDLL